VLNKEQKKAAHSLNPAIVTAGPGSGKTKTLIERVAFLLNNNISPYEILCFTFTRSAAKEMKERLEARFNITGLTITTIHSFCLNLIREGHDLLGFKEHILTYDSVDSEDLKDIIAKEHKWEYNPRKEDSCKDIDKINKEYHNRLREYNAVNFDQMQEFAIKLFDKGHMKHIQDRFRYVIIDEMQDISDVDFELVKYISKIHHNVFCCGDLEQCIFEFRGSNPNLIKHLSGFNKDGYEVELFQSYRCPQKVLDLCNTLAGTKLKSCVGEGKAPVFNEFDCIEEEAEFIMDICKSENPKSVGILCRTNKIIESISRHFLERGFDHHVVGNKILLMDDPSVRTFNSFIKMRHNRRDYLQFFNVMPILYENIPVRQIRRVRSQSVIENKDLIDIAERDFDVSIFSLPQDDFIEKVSDLLDKWYRERGMTTKADTVIKYTEFIYEWFVINPGKDLVDFVYYLSDLTVTEDSHKEVEDNPINLLTIHASKGLEFDYVFIPQINKNAFRSNDRNVLFVAMSRTKQKLFMSYSRFVYYGDLTKAIKPSIFLSDLYLVNMER